MNNVIAPPYDVITESYRDELLKKSAYNIVNLILPDGSKDISDENNCYKNAAKIYKNWLDNEILISNDKPCILYLVQKYEKNGKHITRKGFIARNRIEDFSTKNILPHEYTMSGPKELHDDVFHLVRLGFNNLDVLRPSHETHVEQRLQRVELARVELDAETLRCQRSIVLDGHQALHRQMLREEAQVEAIVHDDGHTHIGFGESLHFHADFHRLGR